MKDFMYSYPTKVYFGDGEAEKAFRLNWQRQEKK